MTRPMDKVFMVPSSESKVFQADGFLASVLAVATVLLFAGIAGWFLMLGFGLIAAVFLGVLAFCALSVFFAVTAPIWGLILSLFYVLLLILVAPFYSLYMRFSRTHRAS